MKNNEFSYGGDVEFGIYDLQDIHYIATSLSDAYNEVRRICEMLDEISSIQLKMYVPIKQQTINIKSIRTKATDFKKIIEDDYEAIQEEYKKRVCKLIDKTANDRDALIAGAKDLLGIMDLELF